MKLMTFTKIICIFFLLGITCLFSCSTEIEDGIELEKELVSLDSQDTEFIESLNLFLRTYNIPNDKISEHDDHFLIDGCIHLTKEELNRNFAKKISGNKLNGENLQATTNALINYTPGVKRTITYRIADIPTSGPQNWRPNIQEAMAAWSNIRNFNFNFVETTSSTADITFVEFNNMSAIASASWPQNGNPGTIIRVNLNYSNLPSSQKTFVMAHEIGHTLGFRHTDWNLQNEGQGVIGANLVRGTWNNDNASVMNSGLFHPNIPNWQNFSRYDILAGRTIYPFDNGERPLYTYYKNLSGNKKSHNWTGNWNEFGLSANGFTYRGVTGFIYNYQKSQTVPLYRYQNSVGYYYLSRNPNLQTNFPDFQNRVLIGYVYNSPSEDNIPVYEYYNSSEGHFFTSNFNDAWMSGSGWSGGGIAFYVGK
ncbi:M57 family metalloprotease [Belliella pelovolcani]|uniref:Dual-action HEIGH metallo-peptidase n=1 Tax=Belliella pelovolcani TaxID=529505 RepID=A0A1N7KHF1_9BACT|nr:M57 family metalloprotease [Belliella pelovolcani]SIS60977.1 Dual-action HEIGH metallo-peptidase [Belliella pelovolcani]